MTDKKKCQDEFTAKMHDTMWISEAKERCCRARLVLELTAPGEPDFEKWCESYRVTTMEVRHQQQLLRIRKERNI